MDGAELLYDELFFDLLFAATSCKLGDLNELQFQVLEISAGLVRYRSIYSYHFIGNKGSFERKETRLKKLLIFLATEKEWLTLVYANYDLVRLFKENKEASCQVTVRREWTIESARIESVQVQRRLDSEYFDDFVVDHTIQ